MVKVKPDNDTGSGHSNSTIGGSTSFNLEGLTGKDGKSLYWVIQWFRKSFVTSIHNKHWKTIYFHIFIYFAADSSDFSMTTSQTQLITNGICSFSPTSTKGKWIFMLQTIILSFTPIVILLAQNGSSFYYLTKEKDSILHKNNLVRQIVLYQ